MEGLGGAKSNARRQQAGAAGQTKKAETRSFGFREKLAATYSRRIYKTTTIGKTVFDGRVRNGNGSDHSFMATKKRESEAGIKNGVQNRGDRSLRIGSADKM